MKLTAKRLRNMIKEEIAKEGIGDWVKDKMGMGGNDESLSAEDHKQQLLDKINSLRREFSDSPRDFLAEVSEETLRTPLVDELTLTQIAEVVDEVIKFDAEALEGLQRLSADLKKDASY